MATQRSTIGFVLVELATVTAITAALASLSIPTPFHSATPQTPAIERVERPNKLTAPRVVEFISFAPEGGVYIHCRQLGGHQAPRCEATIGMDALQEVELWRDAGCIPPARRAHPPFDPGRRG